MGRAPWEKGGGGVTTALTCRSSRILVSSFGRASGGPIRSWNWVNICSPIWEKSEIRPRERRREEERLLRLCRTARWRPLDSKPLLAFDPIYRNSHLRFDSIRFLLSKLFSFFSIVFSIVEITRSTVIINESISLHRTWLDLYKSLFNRNVIEILG